MRPAWLNEAIRASRLHAGVVFPRKLLNEVSLALPLDVVSLPGLSTQRIQAWLADREIQHPVNERNRLLHGCLVAQSGHGIVFLDADDDEHERRFSLAHEVAHFVLDHMLPRDHALNGLGERIRPVLDGERAATREEMFSAVLERVRLGLQVHLMRRDGQGAVSSWDVEESEQRADTLALELLAPADLAINVLRDGDSRTGMVDESAAVERIAEQFGLPIAVANEYARLLRARHQRRPTLSEQLFGEL
jgi:hypothetical protein